MSRCHNGDPPEGADVTAAGTRPQPATTVRSSWASRSGSASTSIATIRPPLTVRARTANGLPSGAQATPPGIAVDEDPGRRLRELTEAHRLPGDGLRAADQRDVSSGRAAPPSERTDDVRVEDGEEAFEVTVTRRREEGVDDGPLAIQIDVGHGRALDAATGTARELPRRRRRPADDRCDLVERHGEDVVQHEGDPFGGRQGVEDDEHREPDRIAQQGFLLGIDARPPDSRSGPGRGSPGTLRGASCATAAC